jgi:ribonuclease P protein component
MEARAKPGRLTAIRLLAVITGCPKRASIRQPAFRPRCPRAPGSHHETHLPSLESPARTHARLPRPDEIARRPCRHQRPSSQGAQAPCGLTPRRTGADMGQRPRPAGPLARLVKSADFERVLRIRRRAATVHFAVHHLVARPGAARRALPGAAPAELSTIVMPAGALPVEDSSANGPAPERAWVGAVVPKRHARRAVTRSLLKRQIYAAAERHRDRLGPGLWIVRLRSPFERTRFVSAASQALRDDARAELEALLEAAVAAPALR